MLLGDKSKSIAVDGVPVGVGGYGYTDPKARHHHHRHKKKSLWKRLLEKLKK